MGKKHKPKIETEKLIRRPSEFPSANIRIIEYMAKKGATEQEIADVLDVTVLTIYNWKKAHPEFFEQLKSWKLEADEKVERSLYERAMGYEHKETKLFCHEGMIIAEDITRRYPPDTTAGIFWLKNRLPKDWRDKQEHSFESAEDAELIREVAELMKDKLK